MVKNNRCFSFFEKGAPVFSFLRLLTGKMRWFLVQGAVGACVNGVHLYFLLRHFCEKWGLSAKKEHAILRPSYMTDGNKRETSCEV